MDPYLKRWAAICYSGLGRHHVFTDDYDAAIDALGKSIVLWTELDNARPDAFDKAGLGSALFHLANVHNVKRDHSAAVRYMSEAVDMLRAAGPQRARNPLFAISLIDAERALGRLTTVLPSGD